MKKVVLKLEVYDEKAKQKAMKTVSGLSGVDSIAIDMKDKRLTLTGDIDPVKVVAKLRKLCHTEIVTVGPAKEPEKKKEEPQKKKDDQPKKDEPKKGGDEKKKDEPKKDDVSQLLKAYQGYHQQLQPPPTYYYYRSVEEDQNSCVIF